MEFKEYRDEINHIFSHYTKRGFVDYRDCRGLFSDMASLLTEATADLSRKGQFKELFELTNKAFLKWGNTSKDDSDGETQDFVWYAYEAWDAVYNADDETMPHAKMLEWYMKHLDGSVIDYMEDEIYRYMMEHFDEDYLLNKKMDFLKKQIEEQQASDDKFVIEYHMPRCQEYVLVLMGQLHYPIDEIRTYGGTINRYFVKESLAKIELDYGNANEAIALYEELADREDRAWGRNKYREKLMQIYKDMGDHENYFKSLKAAMLSGVGDTNLWQEYKSNFKADEWREACEEIFGLLKSGDYRANTWYAEEKRFDLIMANVEKFVATDQLKAYEKSLKKLYPDRCKALLVVSADKMAEEGNKRADYRRLAAVLRWIQKYPDGDETAEQLAQKYREAYPRRKAMLEELAGF